MNDNEGAKVGVCHKAGELSVLSLSELGGILKPNIIFAAPYELFPIPHSVFSS
jgi:hypothetical protein